MARSQPDLFATLPSLPEGMMYQEEFITAADEEKLLSGARGLALQAFEFRGFTGRRRVISFGWRYDFTDHRLHKAEPLPDFLLDLRERAGRLARLPPCDLSHALVTEYAPGSAIGWHRDRPQFGQVIGVSLGAPCSFRMRKRSGTKWGRRTLELAPRSAYVLRGPARLEWEHSIPPVESWRYSVTFRTLAREPSV
jgi:alkylated DNA repair dioxygenase AlkB